jgi:hypothetical protein
MKRLRASVMRQGSGSRSQTPMSGESYGDRFSNAIALPAAIASSPAPSLCRSITSVRKMTID